MFNAIPQSLYLRERPGSHCIGGWVGPRARLDGCGKSGRLTRSRTSDRPALSEPLYRLSYPGSKQLTVMYLISNTYASYACCWRKYSVSTVYAPIRSTDPDCLRRYIILFPSFFHYSLATYGLIWIIRKPDIRYCTVVTIYSISLWVLQYYCRSQWPRGVKRRSAASRLLRLWVRIPPGEWMFVFSVVCCQVEVSEMSWSLAQRSLTDCGVSLCVI